MLDILLYLVAAILFALAAFKVAATRLNLIALGLLAWVLVPLLHALGAA